MVLIFKCANGVVAWHTTKRKDGTYALVCARDGFSTPLSQVADSTWESALTAATTHSVALAGAFQNVYVLPNRI